MFHCFSSQEVTPKEQKNSGTEYAGVLITCHIPQCSACYDVHTQHARVLHMLYLDLDSTPVLKRTTIIRKVKIVHCAKIVGYCISIVSTKCVLCTMLVGKRYILWYENCALWKYCLTCDKFTLCMLMISETFRINSRWIIRPYTTVNMLVYV